MSATSKHLPKDAANLPVGSHYNESADEHQVTKGATGASRVRVADGDDVALGARDDAPASGDLTGSFSLVSIYKEKLQHLRTLTS